MKKLTIGLFLDQHEPYVSGATMAVKSLKAAYEKRGHRVYIICPAVKGYVDKDRGIVRIKALHWLTIDENHDVALPTRHDLRRLRRLKLDIVHSHDVFFCAYLGLMLAQRDGLPYIQTYHTLFHRYVEQVRFQWYIYPLTYFAALFYYPFGFGWRRAARLLRLPAADSRQLSKTGRFMWQHMINMGQAADAVVTPSKHFQAELTKFGMGQPISLITNGITPNLHARRTVLPSRRPGYLRVIYVGRLSREKRVHVLVEALKFSPKVELVVVGEGPEASPLLQQAKQSGVAARVVLTGLLANDKVRQAMRESDVFALPSYDFDNQPVVVLEALDAGLPVLYCDPRLQEGLTKQNALLVSKQPEDFAKGFEKLADSKQRASMGRASRRLTKNFSADYVASQYLEIYQRLLKSN